jgi:hypothetical protein
VGGVGQMGGVGWAGEGKGGGADGWGRVGRGGEGRCGGADGWGRVVTWAVPSPPTTADIAVTNPPSKHIIDK